MEALKNLNDSINYIIEIVEFKKTKKFSNHTLLLLILQRERIDIRAMEDMIGMISFESKNEII